VADVVAGKVARLHKRSTICDLGENLTQTGVIGPAAKERVLTCVDAYLEEARRLGVARICCTLTSAARDAGNSSELLDAFARRGLDAQVIPGEVEGRLTLLGVCQDFPGALVLVADNGGGSTELALGRLADGVLDARAVRSVDVGCRRITERCLPGDGPATPEQLSAAHAFARRPFAATVADLGLKDCGAERLVVTGGTATSLIAIRDGLVP
jgi:exopolyphosphatase/guanosine-5'-triphosphate,3'-diphosphate pyrophosphatase